VGEVEAGEVPPAVTQSALHHLQTAGWFEKTGVK
jgi:hypothetical protein